MISERGYDLKDMSVWHRDKSWVLEKNEIHRFPHAVLEIKLEIKGNDMSPPQWVTDLQNSGLLYECHKYSKFVHGCAVLLPEDVQYVPYWIDDVSLRQAIIDSDGQGILATESDGVGPGANEMYGHLLPFGTTVDNRMETAVGRTSADIATAKGLVAEKTPLLSNKQTNGVDFYSGDDDMAIESEEGNDGICGWMFPFCSRNNMGAGAYDDFLTPTSVQKIEPKVFFANERTYLHWLHHGVILSSIASSILAFSEHSGNTWGQMYALLLLPISLGFCIYALNTFLWRADRIRSRIPSSWADAVGPIYLGSILALVLTLNLFVKLYSIIQAGRHGTV
jgi:VTC domain/Domain of unknown function (DUF202)